MTRFLFMLFLFSLAGHAALAQSRGELAHELDLFAVAHFDRIQPLSIRDNAEYCGLFGYDAAGNLAATRAARGDADGCAPHDEPPGFEVIASYHTHGAYSEDADAEVPSVDDLLSDFEEGIDGYVATPGGRVWLNLFADTMSFQICGPGCVVPDPNHRPCPGFAPAPEYTIDELRQRERTDPGEC